MTPDEKEIELMMENLEVDKALKTPPLFEMYITLFSLGTAIVLFLFPGMLDEGNANVYDWMTRIMSQNGWALVFFLASLLKASGLLFNQNILRYGGLIISSLIYLTMTICYTTGFPALGTVQFACMTLFSLLSISVVKHTGIER